MKYLFPLSLVFVTHNCPFLPLPLLYPLFLTAENCAKHRLYKYTDSQTLLETQKSPVVQANEYEGKMEVVQHELPHCTATLNPDCACVLLFVFKYKYAWMHARVQGKYDGHRTTVAVCKLG